MAPKPSNPKSAMSPPPSNGSGSAARKRRRVTTTTTTIQTHADGTATTKISTLSHEYDDDNDEYQVGPMR